MSYRLTLTAVVAVGVLAVAVPTYADGPGKGAYAPSQSGEGPGNSGSSARPTATPTPTPRGIQHPPGLTTPTPTATPAPGAPATPAPTPVPGESVVAGTPAGKVTVRKPDGSEAVLGAGADIPVGSTIDATDGTIELQTALPDGTVQRATFGGGAFEIRQDARSGYTDLYLRGGSFARCAAPAHRALASISRSKPKRTRKLWGRDDGGRYRTHGRNSVATVRGTRWLTKDTCSGTLTRVTEGAVDVRDKHRHRTVTVRRGHSYLARAR